MSTAAIAALLLGSALAHGHEMDLVWNPPGQPHTHFALCAQHHGPEEDEEEVEYCAPPGTWWGACMAAGTSGPAARWASGSLSFTADGTARFSGCESWAFALHETAATEKGLSQAKALFPSAICGDGTKPGRLLLGTHAWSWSVGRSGELTLTDHGEAKERDAAKFCAAPAPTGGKAVKRGAATELGWFALDPKWNGLPVGDLDGDGQPEFVLWSTLPRGMPGDLTGFLVSMARPATTTLIAGTMTRYAEVETAPEVMLPKELAAAKATCAKEKKGCASFRRRLAEAKSRYPKNAAIQKLQE